MECEPVASPPAEHATSRPHLKHAEQAIQRPQLGLFEFYRIAARNCASVSGPTAGIPKCMNSESDIPFFFEIQIRPRTRRMMMIKRTSPTPPLG
jgi:hypothetical protein